VSRPLSSGIATVALTLALAGCAAAPRTAPAPVAEAPLVLPPLPVAPSGGVLLAALARPAAPSLLQARAVLASRAPRLDALAREGVAQLLARAERRHGIAPLLLLALIEQESRFDPCARGPHGSLGLMQVRPFVGRDVAARAGWRFDDTTLLDPVENVRIGTRYLAELHARFGNTELALAAYNAGPTRIRRLQARGLPCRTRYVKRVLARYEGLQSVGPAVGLETLAGS